MSGSSCSGSSGSSGSSTSGGSGCGLVAEVDEYAFSGVYGDGDGGGGVTPKRAKLGGDADADAVGNGDEHGDDHDHKPVNTIDLVAAVMKELVLAVVKQPFVFVAMTSKAVWGVVAEDAAKMKSGECMTRIVCLSEDTSGGVEIMVSLMSLLGIHDRVSMSALKKQEIRDDDDRYLWFRLPPSVDIFNVSPWTGTQVTSLPALEKGNWLADVVDNLFPVARRANIFGTVHIETPVGGVKAAKAGGTKHTILTYLFSLDEETLKAARAALVMEVPLTLVSRERCNFEKCGIFEPPKGMPFVFRLA